MDNYKHIVLQFDQAQQPKFREVKSKGWVEFGEKNNYPNYLLSLFNESPKHGAIVKGKCNYIYGKGFEEAGQANGKDTWNDVMKKAIKDDELYRGYYLQCIWNRAKKLSEVYHLEFHKVRVSKDLQTFFVKNDWADFKEKPREYKAFNVNDPVGSQILYVKEYNPSSEVYPYPSYFQGLNYIESDIEVSRHILGNAKQGWVGSKLVNLNNGDPIGEENKGEVERGLLKKFTGDSGKRVVIMFNKSKENSAEILDLGQTMLTKEDFTNVNNLITQEVFASHQITSPVLFGIKSDGQLGARNEIRDAYQIFSNTYVQGRQQEIEEVFSYLRNLKGEVGEFKIQPLEPLSFEFSEAIMAQNLTKDEIRELMGKEPLDDTVKTQAQIISDNINALSPLVANKVLESMSPDEIRSLAGLVPKGVDSIPQQDNVPVQNEIQVDGNTAAPYTNDAIKNLSGRQYQNVMRIVRQFGTGKLTKAQASLMLKNGFGFNDKDVNDFLGLDDSPLTKDEIAKFSMTNDERLLEAFGNHGDSPDNYIVVSKKKVSEVSEYESFAEISSLNQLQANILDLISKDKRITPEVIASTLKQSVKDVEQTIKDLVDNEYLKQNQSKIGTDVIIERELTAPISELQGKNPSKKVTEILIRYSYEGPQDSRNRPFCARLMKLNKFYSRSDIEQISMIMGYSVWDRRGGWFTEPDGSHRPYCRHSWIANIVKRKD